MSEELERRRFEDSDMAHVSHPAALAVEQVLPMTLWNPDFGATDEALDMFATKLRSLIPADPDWLLPRHAEYSRILSDPELLHAYYRVLRFERIVLQVMGLELTGPQPYPDDEL